MNLEILAGKWKQFKGESRRLLGILFDDHHHPVRRRPGEGPEDDRSQDAEHRGRAPDAEGEREDDGDGISRRSAEGSQGVAEIAQHKGSRLDDDPAI